MLSKIKSFIKQLNQLVLVGLIASFAWVGGATFIYFNEIVNHRKYSTRHLRTYFSWKLYKNSPKVYINYDEADSARIALESERSASEWKIRSPEPSPVFNLIGYLAFLFLPIALGWGFVWLILLLHFRNIFLKIWHGFKSSDFVAKTIVIGVFSYLGLLWMNDGDISSSIIYLLSIYIITSAFLVSVYYLSRGIWFCIKAAVYGIVYAATRAINDARAQK